MSERERCLGRLLGKVKRTCRRWALLPSGVPIALGVSGGTDSLALVTLVTALNRTLREPHPVIGIHVRVDADGLAPVLPEASTSWCAEQGVEVVEVEPRLEARETPPLGCFECARVRRRTLLEEADRRGYRLVALGHHGDDVVETYLLTLFYTGRAEGMGARRDYFDGTVTVVRPLYELRKSELERLTRLAEAPVATSSCRRDQEEASRERIRRALAAMGSDQRRVRRQLFWAAERRARGAGPAVDENQG